MLVGMGSIKMDQGRRSMGTFCCVMGFVSAASIPFEFEIRITFLDRSIMELNVPRVYEFDGRKMNKRIEANKFGCGGDRREMRAASSAST